jgi:LysR family glycine cleavage system transcriptional activator
MASRLPGLGAFATFEAAARHQSFSRAAEELNVTPAAVSYLVRGLETQLKVKLFHRTKRVVRLTEAGRILSDGVTNALGDIGRAVERLRAADKTTMLRVTTTPSFAIKWLVPRLDGFLKLYPEVDVRVDLSVRTVDLAREDMDVAIRFGAGHYPGMQAERLMTDTLTPVCSPRLLKGKRPVRHPRDLKQFTLIHVDWQGDWRGLGGTWPTWAMWMASAGITDIDTSRGLYFDQGVAAIQAAIDGQGVALGDSSLITTDLAEGRLVRLFDHAVAAPAHFAYWTVVTPPAAERPLVRAFCDWLRAEAAAKPKPKRRRM